MNMRAVRGFFIATLALNVVLVSFMMMDYFYANSRFFSAILVSMGLLVVLTAVLMILLVVDETPKPAMLETAEAEPLPFEEPEVEEEMVTVRPKIVHGLSPVDEEPVPFVFNGYTLHARDVAMKGGDKRTIYFFSKRAPKSGSPVGKPAGYHVGVNENTGLPFLKKGLGADGEDVTPHPEQALRPQCGALTEDGKQCRNSARASSKYCMSHFGYQPPMLGKAEAARRDTIARVRDAPDTLPSVRKAQAR